MDITRRSLGAEHPAIAAGHHNIATALSEAGRYDEALAQFAHAIDAQDLVLDLTHPDRAHPRLGIASDYRRQGRCAEALPWMREALALRRTLAPDHRYVAQTLRDPSRRSIVMMKPRAPSVRPTPSIPPRVSPAIRTWSARSD